MPRISRFQRDFRNLHGVDAEMVAPTSAGAGRQLPLAHWPVWLRAIVLAPIIIALLAFSGLLLFVAVGFAWMMGSAFFGPFWGGCIAIFAALVAVSAVLVGLFGQRT